MDPNRVALYVEANDTKNWTLIAPVYFVCGYQEEPNGPYCNGQIKAERGLIGDPDVYFDCPVCGMLETGETLAGRTA